MSISQILKSLHPGGSEDLPSILLKQGFGRPLPFQMVPNDTCAPQWLVSKICHLVSSKRSDVLLTASNEPILKHHHLRNSLSPKLWKWQVVCGWKWRPHRSGSPDHTNKLKLRAVQTALRWRRAHFVDPIVDLIFKKWPEPVSFLKIFKWNQALATVCCTFCRPHLQKGVRPVGFLTNSYISRFVITCYLSYYSY